MTFSPERIVRAVDRELSFRRRLYPRKVANHEMTQQEADEEIGIFEQIKADYRAQIEAGAPKLL